MPGWEQRGFSWCFEASQWQGEGAQLCFLLSKSPLLPSAHKMLFPDKGFVTPSLTGKGVRVGEQGRDFHKSSNILCITQLLLQGQHSPLRGFPSSDQCSRSDSNTSQLQQGSFCSSPWNHGSQHWDCQRETSCWALGLFTIGMAPCRWEVGSAGAHQHHICPRDRSVRKHECPCDCTGDEVCALCSSCRKV